MIEIYVGIDPGKTGGGVAISTWSRTVNPKKKGQWPDFKVFKVLEPTPKNVIRPVRPVIAVEYTPRFGKVTVSAGVYLAMFLAMNQMDLNAAVIYYVTPGQWRKVIGQHLKVKVPTERTTAKAWAVRLANNLSNYEQPVQSDHEAEARLLCLYAQLFHKSVDSRSKTSQSKNKTATVGKTKGAK